MAYNVLGDLDKSDIIVELGKRGIIIKSVQMLNKILKDMGMIEKNGNGWMTTLKGVAKTIYKSRVMNADAWPPEIVDDIVKHLNK